MFTKLEQRSRIQIKVAWGRSTQECYQGLREACGEAALPYRTVARWVKHSRKAGIPFKTTPHGQQHSSTPCFPVGCWSQMDCAWVSSRSLSMSQNCAPHSGYQQTCSALDTHMKFPRCNNGTTMQSQRPYWIRYQRESDDFLERIVTMYKTWAHSYEPNLKMPIIWMEASCCCCHGPLMPLAIGDSETFTVLTRYESMLLWSLHQSEKTTERDPAQHKRWTYPCYSEVNTEHQQRWMHWLCTISSKYLAKGDK